MIEEIVLCWSILPVVKVVVEESVSFVKEEEEKKTEINHCFLPGVPLS